MLRERVFRLLQQIDAVEYELRHLESRLTSVRVQLRSELLHDSKADCKPESEQAVQR